MSETERSAAPNHLCDAIDELADAIELVNDRLDEVDGSIKGIHRGIGDGDRSVKSELHELKNLVQGLAADVRTALTTIPSLNARILKLEDELATLRPEAPSNGAITQ